MDTSLDEVLTPVAKAKGIGLINASPLHRRVLTNKGAPDWHPAPKRVLEVEQQAADACRDWNAAPAKFSKILGEVKK